VASAGSASARRIDRPASSRTLTQHKIVRARLFLI
jgi:hypothetical protein